MARILIIDDSGFSRRQLKKALQQLAHEVIEAGGGAEGIDLARSSGPDVVITDLLMPEVDGFAVVEAIRASPGLSATLPVFVLSADVQNSSRQRAEEVGATGFLSKPAKLEALAATLGELGLSNAAG